jgi:hypothetical protein
VLLGSLYLELSETHERIDRPCRELLCLPERDPPHTRRSAIRDALEEIDLRDA